MFCFPLNLTALISMHLLKTSLVFGDSDGTGRLSVGRFFGWLCRHFGGGYTRVVACFCVFDSLVLDFD